MRIGVFDSGLGGLTVVKEMMNHLEGVDVIYLGDTARLPYGTKSEDTVCAYAMQDVQFLLRYEIDLIVIACHSASAYAARLLEERCEIPVWDMIRPVYKKVIQEVDPESVGVIATQATVASGAYQEIKSLACPLLVGLAEVGWIDSDIAYAIIHKYLDGFVDDQMTTLILGCTHFPLFKTVLKQVLGSAVSLLDPAEELVQQLQSEYQIPEGQGHRLEIYVTDMVHNFQEMLPLFLQRSADVIEHVSLTQEEVYQ